MSQAHTRICFEARLSTHAASGALTNLAALGMKHPRSSKGSESLGKAAPVVAHIASTPDRPSVPDTSQVAGSARAVSFFKII
ncbi:hypothetical protein IQ22_04535 [Pseudomonas duriflava]|uniref:Uncharacterized protein n=1 Tax=Pseudomonas duriflava TaxID=459528 RepID=A0A562PPP6_9PSED|nr:hypothetical protein IQ22_04535 [Pseudomonas duriflava]